MREKHPSTVLPPQLPGHLCTPNSQPTLCGSILSPHDEVVLAAEDRELQAGTSVPNDMENTGRFQGAKLGPAQCGSKRLIKIPQLMVTAQWKIAQL